MPDLLKAGTVDAVTITDPLRSIAVKQGVGYVYADYAADLLPDVLMIGYISTGDWAAKNSKAIHDFRASLDEAADYIVAHPDEIPPIEKQYLGFTFPSKSNWSTAIKADDLNPYIAIGKEFHLYKTALDPAKLIVK